jgi:hypothetical protein
MRWVFLVVGFLAGLVLGLVLSYREAPRHLPSHVPVVRHVERKPQRAARAEAPPAAPDPAAPVVLDPTGDLSAEDAEDIAGRGRIEVDFEGFPGERTAWVTRMTLEGLSEDEDAAPGGDETVAVFEVVPGVCDVWWLRGPHRLGTRVRAVEGRVVRIRAVDFDTTVIPRHLAALGIRVGASWGGVLPSFRVSVEAADGRLVLDTNQHGCVNATLRPGPADVKVGDQVTPVVLVAGRETVLDVTHRGEGDVLFEPYGGAKGWLALRTPGKLGFPRRQRYMREGRDGFLYIKAGKYEVVRTLLRRYFGGSVIGTVQVCAGRASVFRVELPPGVLYIRVDVNDAVLRRDKYVQVTLHSVGVKDFVFLDRVPARQAPGDGKYVRRVRVDGLQPGRFRLTCGDADETVDVGAGTTEVVLRPQR